ncbi:HAD family hydrolase [Guptibacillus hwajinpoensis]|uniref:HAD family hydrolase n=1 Tax=Guptibacillus hwajinpoensis TaxID=208199 RepID=UPI001CFF4942|nr:HAD family hydrolase [Pseudalkalibacillus hwajinpoensis]WLR61519.1 HAD family hydrolase [Pseudalkalibacillus hwajinpoensis]
MIKAVIFDLDDTLVSEYQYIESGYSHISQLLSSRLNKDSKSINALLEDLFNQNTQNVFNRLYDLLEIQYTNEMIMDLVEEYRNHEPAIDFYDDVLPCLYDLKLQEIKTGIITNGYAKAQNLKLRVVKGFDHFDEIIIADELGKEYWKPHPKPYEMMSKKLNMAYSEMVYVGDNESKDFVSPNKLGMKTVHIRRPKGVYSDGYHSYGQDFQAQYSINSLKELLEVLT